MVNNTSAALDAVFGALADPTRRGILTRLAQGEATVGELGAPFDITKGAVTKHIKVLERSGLLKRDVQGRVHRCEMDVRALDEADAWIDEVRVFWEGRFDALATYLDALQSKEVEE